MSAPLDILRAGRYWALRQRPYLATTLLSFQLVERPGLAAELGGPVAVDERLRLYYDSQALASLGWTAPQAGAVLVHEVAHVLRGHADRARRLGVTDETHQAANVCADCEINDDLAAEGLPLPPGCCYPDDFGWPLDQLFETYFAALPERRSRPKPGQPAGQPGAGQPGAGQGASGAAKGTGQGEGQAQGNGSSADGVPRSYELPGGSLEAPGSSAAEVQAVRAETARAIQSAAKSRGFFPAHWLRAADAILAPPQVDWQAELQAELRSSLRYCAGGPHATYSRPSRRAIPGVVLPGYRRPVPEVAAIVDTSGSMDDGDELECLAEVDGALRAAGGYELRFLAVDAAVHVDIRVRSAVEAARALRGGGGTSMTRGIEHVMSTGRRPDVIIVLTDGHTDWPTTAPEARVIVVLTSRSAAHHSSVPQWARCIELPGAERPKRGSNA